MMLGIGPHVILDKSVLEMLSGDEFSLLTEYFRLVVPPVLTEEIVADLELKPTERRLPDVVVALKGDGWPRGRAKWRCFSPSVSNGPPSLPG